MQEVTCGGDICRATLPGAAHTDLGWGSVSSGDGKWLDRPWGCP